MKLLIYSKIMIYLIQKIFYELILLFLVYFFKNIHSKLLLYIINIIY